LSASGTESRGKARRILAEQARRLAAEGRWAEAIEVNRQLIERTPKDVDAYNRLGKAYFELHRYRSAWEAYSTAAELDPANVIAQRNLSRIEPLKDIEVDDHQPHPRHIRLGIFIEEVGKTYVDDLVNCADATILTELSSGDKLELRITGQQVELIDAEGRVVGELEPRLARRMIELIGLGNQYEAYVTSNTGQSVRVIIRETFKIPAMGNRLSFPRQGKVAIPRAYLRDTRLFRDEPDMLLGDDEDDEGDIDDVDEFDATEGDDEESDYIEEAGASADEEEEEL
jgi:tetratricopeptide (TPR) repeat protein